MADGITAFRIGIGLKCTVAPNHQPRYDFLPGFECLAGIPVADYIVIKAGIAALHKEEICLGKPENFQGKAVVGRTAVGEGCRNPHFEFSNRSVGMGWGSRRRTVAVSESPADAAETKPGWRCITEVAELAKTNFGRSVYDSLGKQRK
jgi:hypothetical protein